MNLDAGKYLIAGDVGGTGTRIGLFKPQENRPVLETVERFSNSGYSDLESIVEKFLGNRRIEVSEACFAIAGPVEKGRCRATNLPWEVSEKDLQKKLSLKRVRLINDLDATIRATLFLKDDELFVLQKGEPDGDGARAVVAPGTGLGMSLMVKARGEYISIPSEGGHAGFAPNSEQEAELWRHIRNARGHASVERVVSGPGLVAIYEWLVSEQGNTKPVWLSKRMESEDPAKVVSEAALKKEDPLCVRALQVFVSALGSVAGDLALIGLPFGGLYLGGGIPPKILSFLKENFFLHSFSDKGRFHKLLKKIPVYVILNDLAALLGAAASTGSQLRLH